MLQIINFDKSTLIINIYLKKQRMLTILSHTY